MKEVMKMNETSIKYPTKLYAFISGRWEKHIVYIKAESVSTAISNYCKFYGITDYRLEAIMSVAFVSALKLANEWLDEEIVEIHEVGTTIYFDKEYAPQIIGEDK